MMVNDLYSSNHSFQSFLSPFLSLETIKAYSILPWNYHFNVSNVTIIDLTYNSSIFNYCDLGSFTKEGVFPLLNTIYNITQDDLDSGL